MHVPFSKLDLINFPKRIPYSAETQLLFIDVWRFEHISKSKLRPFALQLLLYQGSNQHPVVGLVNSVAPYGGTELIATVPQELKKR